MRTTPDGYVMDIGLGIDIDEAWRLAHQIAPRRVYLRAEGVTRVPASWDDGLLGVYVPGWIVLRGRRGAILGRAESLVSACCRMEARS